MAELIIIEAKKRTATGKSYARKLRQRGLAPGVIIGNSQPSIPIELTPKWISRAYQAGKRFILDLEGSQREVMIKEVQIDAIKRSLLHIDLMYV